MNGSFNSVEEAVLCFYQSNNVLQGDAQRWLTQLQETPQIWNIIWEELLPSKHTELQFYGATILHAKLLKDWSDIPIEEIDPLKEKLLKAVVYFKDGPKVVLNRLCISLAVYLLRVTISNWPNAVADLISLFQNPSLFQNVPNANPEILTWLLLEILCVIPEEFQTMILSKNERILIKSSLDGDNLTVLAFLEAALSSPNIDLHLQAVKCSKSWLEFGLPPDNCDNLLILLINTVLLTYTNNEISQCTIGAIEAISTLCIHPNISKCNKKVLYYMEKILLLADIFNASHEITNSDLIPCLYTLFVSIGDVHTKIFIKSLLTEDRDTFLKLLRVILQCSNAPGCYPKDEIYSIQTFNFWYSLQDEINSSESGKKEEILNLIKPFYKSLILVLMEKSMQPKDMSDWSRDDKDNFRCYRQDIADTYTYCHSILRHELLDIIVQHLEQAVEDPNIIANWRKVDSYLYAFFAISESVISSGHPGIMHCILLLQKLPLANMNIHVFQTVMELFGSYAEWMCSHPELLEQVLSLVFTGAENPQLAAPATLALKDITRECKSVLCPYAEGIADKTLELVKRQHLKPTDEVRLVFSLGTVISVLPKETILKYLKEVASPYILKIETILSTVHENPKKAQSEISDCVGVFTQLFLGLIVEPVDPVYCLLQEVLPRFKAILNQYRGNTLISSMCIAIKCAVSNLGESCSELLPSIVELVLTTYFSNPNPNLLDLAKQLLVLFGNNATYAELMSNMLRQICELTLTTFGNTSPENVSQHTTLFEHFYSFCTNVLKKNCKQFLNTEGINLILIFRFAGYALCAQEALTVKAASLFLCNLITVSREQNTLLVVVQAHGAELVYNILIAIGKISPRNCLEPVADVLVGLSKKYCDWLSRWLNEILAPEGFPSSRASSASKQRFIKSVLRDKANKRRVHDVTKEFSFLCRGLLNKEYVDITTSVL